MNSELCYENGEHHPGPMRDSHECSCHGAKGYAGRRLAARLLEEEDVRSRLLVDDARTVWGFEGHPAEIFEGEILDWQSLARAVRGCDVVYFSIRYLITDRTLAEQGIPLRAAGSYPDDLVPDRDPHRFGERDV